VSYSICTILEVDSGKHHTIMGTHDDPCYRLPDGSRLRRYEGPGWCRKCQDFVAIERIPSQLEIEREIEELAQGREKSEGVPFAGLSVEDRLNELTGRLHWRRRRRSGPRCFWCGSEEIEAIPWGQAIHPVTRGTIWVMGCGQSHLPDNWNGEYTEEGEPCEDDARCEDDV
jgi:hypothetical protein